MKIFGRKGDGSAGGFDEAYLGLRSQVLGLTVDGLGLIAGPAPAVIAVLMETGYPGAVALLVGVVDGSTSLYLSNGGGVFRAGEHAHVADATGHWLRACGEELARLAPVAEPLPPEVGVTQFVAVTPGGLLAATAPEAELGAGQHVLSPLFYAGQAVLTQIRLLDEQRS